MQELDRNNSILSHKLADQEAATELEINKRTKLQQEIEKLRAQNSVLEKQEEQWSTQFQTLHRSAKDVEKALLRSLENLNKTVSKLASFDQRIKFASSRIHFISGTIGWYTACILTYRRKCESLFHLFVVELLIHRDSKQKTRSYEEDDKDVEVIPGKFSSL